MDLLPTGNTAEFLLSEAPGERSRALFHLPSGQGYLRPGTMLTSAGEVATDNADIAGVLYGGVNTGDDAGGAPVKATVVDKDAEVHGEFLQWGEGDADAIKAAFSEALAARGIVVRWTHRPEGAENDNPTEPVADPPAGGDN